MKNKIQNLLIFMISILIFSNSLLTENFWGRIPSIPGTEGKVIRFSSNNTMYIGFWGIGIKKSTNSGSTFTDINNGLSNKFINCMEIAPNGNIFVGTYGGGIFRSTDNGNNWTAVNNGLTNLKIRSMNINSKGEIWIGTFGSGVFFSNDNGNNWVNKSNGIYYRDITAIIAFTDSTIIAGTSAVGIFKSTDKGESWYHSSPGVDSTTVTCFYKDPLNQLYLGTIGSGVFMSVNAGSSWQAYQPSTSPKNITSIQGYKTDAVVVGTYDVGVWRYDLTYEKWRSPDMNTDAVNDLRQDNNGTYWIICPNSGLWKNTDNLVYDWANIGLQNTSTIKLLAVFDNILYYKNGAEGMIRSTDLGLTWNPNAILPGKTVSSIAKDSNGVLFATANASGTSRFGYIYKSTDNGINWEEIVAKQDTNFFGIGIKKNGYIFVGANWPPQGTGDPKTTVHGAIFRSTDNSNTFSVLSNPRVANPPYVIGINSLGHVFAQLMPGFSKTTNDGIAWSAIGLTAVTVNDVAFNSNNDIVIATENGYTYSFNNGATYTNADFNPSKNQVTSVASTKSGSFYLASEYKYPYLIRTTNRGLDWEIINSGISCKTNASLINNGKGLLLFSSTSVYKGIESSDIGKPTLIDLKQDSNGVILKPTFKWKSVEYADLYEIQISDVLDFSNIVAYMTISDTSWTFNNELEYNKMYLWRVRAKINSSIGDWSEYRRFYTMQAPPILKLPLNYSTGHQVDVNLVWYSVDGAKQYYVTVSTDSTFSSNLVLNNKLVTDTTFSLTNLQLLTQYYWKVQAVTPITKSEWSKVWRFKTTLKPVTLISPKNNTYGLGKEVTMVWDTSKSATNYIIQIATDPDFNNKIFAGNADDFNRHTIKIFQYFTTYYWRVQAYSQEGYSDFSVVWKFTTGISPIDLESPKDSSKNIETTVNFSWYKNLNATQYHFILSTDKDFKNIIYNDSTLTENKVSVNGLNNFTNYYWKVRAKKDNLTGFWSDYWTFITNLGTPTLKYPSNNTDNMDINITLEWNKLSGAKLYEVQIAKDSSFKGSVIIADSLSDLYKDFSKLEFDTYYYWRVRAKYEYGISPWSDIWKFRTRYNNTGVEVNEFDTIYLYPNPFSDELSLKLYISNESKLNISIYNIEGSLVANIFEGYKGTGLHLFTYNPLNQLSQGEYLLRIKYGNNEITKKVIYQK